MEVIKNIKYSTDKMRNQKIIPSKKVKNTTPAGNLQ